MFLHDVPKLEDAWHAATSAAHGGDGPKREQRPAERPKKDSGDKHSPGAAHALSLFGHLAESGGHEAQAGVDAASAGLVAAMGGAAGLGGLASKGTGETRHAMDEASPYSRQSHEDRDDIMDLARHEHRAAWRR